MAVSARTVTAVELGCDRLTVKAAEAVPLFPSMTEASSIEIAGTPSSSRIVAVPWARATVAPVGAERLRVNVSSGSVVLSPMTSTVTTSTSSPGRKVTAWLVTVVKSVTGVAVPAAVDALTVSSRILGDPTYLRPALASDLNA